VLDALCWGKDAFTGDGPGHTASKLASAALPVASVALLAGAPVIAVVNALVHGALGATDLLQAAAWTQIARREGHTPAPSVITDWR
jgi:hypothetical protein